MLIKIMLTALTSLILINTLKQIKSEYALPLTITSSVVMFGIILSEAEPIINYIKKLTEQLQIDRDLIGTIFKICIISYLKNFICNLCNDYGYKSISDKVDLAVRISLISLCIPWITKLYININKLL